MLDAVLPQSSQPTFQFSLSFQYLLIMADAFGLAVNIFTLLEFGRKFAILTWDIHKDGKGAVSRIASLDLTRKTSETSQVNLASQALHLQPTPGVKPMSGSNSWLRGVPKL